MIKMDIFLVGLIAMAIMAIENKVRKLLFLQEQVDELNKQVNILENQTKRLETLEEIVVNRETL